MSSAFKSQFEQFPLKDGIRIAEFITWLVETQICKECRQIFSQDKGAQQVERLSVFSSNMFALSCRLFILQLLHAMETCVYWPRSLQAGCIKALHAVLCRLDSTEQPKRDLDAVCNQTLMALAPHWEQYAAKLQAGNMQDKEWEEFDKNTPSADFQRTGPPPHLRKATKVVPKSHHYRLAYRMMLGLETAVRAEDGMCLVNTCVYGFEAFQKELEHQMRILGFEPPYPLNHTLNLKQDLDGTEIALETADRVLASVVFKYDLPSTGTLISPTHVLDGQELWFEDLCPAIFSQIRNVSNVEGSEYAWSVAHRGFKYVEFVTNSKSGETFFFSHDGRFIVKTISNEEAEVLIRMLPGYLAHLKANESLLMRICGLYRVASEGTIHGRASRYFIVCLSIFDCGGLGLHLQYDLKGSVKGRKAKPEQSVKKDKDWLAAHSEVDLPSQDKTRLLAAVERDSKFLQGQGVLDYSMLVGIHDRQQGEQGRLCRGVHLLSAIVKNRMLPALRTIRLMRQLTSKGHAARAEDAAGHADAAAPAARRLDLRQPAADGGDGGEGSRGHEGAAGGGGGHARCEGHKRGSVVRPAEQHPPLAKYGGAEGQRYVYFIGMVDFLVPWSLKKQTEYAWNSVRGYRRTGSCVPPEPYADRLIRFMTTSVFKLRPEDRRPTASAGEGSELGSWWSWVLCCFGVSAPSARCSSPAGPELSRPLLTTPLSPERL